MLLVTALVFWQAGLYARREQRAGFGRIVSSLVIVSLIPHDLQYGPQAAMIAESFTGSRRYSGASLGYQLASVIAGGPAPLIATKLLSVYHSSAPISLYIVGCCVVSLLTLAFMKERYKVDHDVEYDMQLVGRAATSARVGAPADQ